MNRYPKPSSDNSEFFAMTLRQSASDPWDTYTALTDGLQLDLRGHVFIDDGINEDESKLRVEQFGPSVLGLGTFALFIADHSKMSPRLIGKWFSLQNASLATGEVPFQKPLDVLWRAVNDVAQNKSKYRHEIGRVVRAARIQGLLVHNQATVAAVEAIMLGEFAVADSPPIDE